MLLFRSEEHVERWLEARSLERGSIFTPNQMWTVAKTWFESRLARDWRRFSVDEAQALFDRAGLRGAFWQLPRPASPPSGS
jgi:hypothetical protein